MQKQCDWWCAACGGHTAGQIRTLSWLKRTLQTPSEAEVFRARAPPQGRLEVTNELGSFIEVNNREAVEIGDLQKNSKAIKVVKPKFNQGDPTERRRAGGS